MGPLRILVAGGGIGGLTAALCLAKRGHEVTVFEQAATFGEVGAGIQLSPNCTRVLHDLGLERQIRATAFLPEAIEVRHWRNGGIIGQSALGEDAVRRYGFPYYHAHRADLLSVLVEAARRVPNIQLLCDAEARCFKQSGSRATLSTTGGDHDGEVLIGADGIHSTIRAGLWGADRPRFTGCVAWRALVPTDCLPRGLVRPMATAWWGPGGHFVHYYVRRGELVNCVGVIEKAGWEVESWTERGDHAEFAADFAGWHGGIRRLIDHADNNSLFKWALHDREPMPRWGEGRVSLLGDACHPTLPFMAQGGRHGHRRCSPRAENRKNNPSIWVTGKVSSCWIRARSMGWGWVGGRHFAAAVGGVEESGSTDARRKGGDPGTARGSVNEARVGLARAR